MIKLIAQPEQYHAKRVMVSGYLHIRFEGNVLYLTKEDALNKNGKSGLWIGYDKKVTSREDLKDYDGYYAKLKPYSEKFVWIEGTFDKNETGHLDCCAAGLVGVSDVLVIRRSN